MSAAETPVEALARRIIEAQGPISIAALMRLANTALPESYYQAQEPFGGRGDFITAPEISQMFGEMLALALADQWQRMGAPAAVDVVELGPGRGVLMADILRTWRQAAPGLLAAASITMIEASQRLREVQRRTLGTHAARVTWAEALPESGRPLLLVANEFFDALPVRQFVRSGDGWRERLVNWTAERGFHDALGPVITAEEEPEGGLWEHSEEAQEWMARIAGRLAQTGGLALIVDYAAQPGETSLRGIRRHRKASPLESIGAVDLSAGVDFSLLARETGSHGALAHGPENQGPYLRRLGIEARHRQLAARADKHQRRELDAALSRLIDGDGMGQDFRVFAATGPTGPHPAAFPHATPDHPPQRPEED